MTKNFQNKAHKRKEKLYPRQTKTKQQLVFRMLKAGQEKLTGRQTDSRGRPLQGRLKLSIRNSFVCDMCFPSYDCKDKRILRLHLAKIHFNRSNTYLQKHSRNPEHARSIPESYRIFPGTVVKHYEDIGKYVRNIVIPSENGQRASKSEKEVVDTINEDIKKY